MYSVGRMMILKKLNEEQIRELQKRENKREFIFSAFSIAYLFRIKKKGFTKISDVDRENLNELFNKNRPRFQDIDNPDVYTEAKTGKELPHHAVENDLEYMHAWDWNIYHNSDIVVSVFGKREDSEIKADLKDGTPD